MTPNQLENERLACRDIEMRENEHCERANWMELRQDGEFEVTEYYDDLYQIECLQKVAMQIVASKELATKSGQGDVNSPIIGLTRIGKALVQLCDVFDPSLPTRHRHEVFNPWIKTMMVALLHWHKGSGFGNAFPALGILPEDQLSLERIVRFVRRACHSRAFHQKIQKEHGLARQNFRSGCSYLASLFASHSRLLILRIDLYYRCEGKDWARTNEAKAAFERFNRMLRTGRIVPDVLGCLFSREYGPERSVHYHIMVILDGHKRKDADGYTRAIGERWVADYAGPGRGTYFNCYERRNEYKYNGLGLVHMADWEKLIGIREALRYMTKAAYLVKAKDYTRRSSAQEAAMSNKTKARRSRVKNFRRGLVKRVDVKHGAPRLPGHEMSTVIRIMGGGQTPDRSR